MNEKINRLTNKILTRFNLDQLNLKTLTANNVKAFKNPNKNSCLLTKLEILEKILQAKGEENATISQYISQLKGPKRENVKPPFIPPLPLRATISNKNKKIELYKKIHPILMNYLENNSRGGILKWKSQDNRNMTAKIIKTVLANNITQTYKNNNILKIPVVEMVNNITKQKINGRVSIYSKKLTIDDVQIKQFFINNCLSEDFVNTLFPSPPFNKQSVNLFTSNKQPLFQIGDKVILREEYYKNNKIEGSCIYKIGNYGIIKEIVQGTINLGKEYIHTYLVDCYDNQNTNLNQKCRIRENKIRKIDK